MRHLLSEDNNDEHLQIVSGWARAHIYTWLWYQRLWRNEYQCQWEPTWIHDIVLLGQQPSAAMAHRRRLGSQYSLIMLELWLWQDKLNFLPEAHTCFNQLVLPDYKKKVTLGKWDSRWFCFLNNMVLLDFTKKVKQWLRNIHEENSDVSMCFLNKRSWYWYHSFPFCRSCSRRNLQLRYRTLKASALNRPPPCDIR